jgi:hypothetical protein
MPTADYEFSVNHQAHNETINSTATLVWEACRRLVAQLKSFPIAPWTTRGSSRNGSAGSAFSATPDGVDHWTTRTSAQVSTTGGIRIWHVLQNSLTGLQVCIETAPATDIRITVSKNKFEVGGAWRGGGSAPNVRPTDTGSSPAAGREASTTSIDPLVSRTAYHVGATGYAISVLNRKDGTGFYLYYWRLPLIQNASAGIGAFSSFMAGVAPALAPTPDINVDNPYVAFYGNSDGLAAALAGASPPDLITGNFRMEGRRPNGTLDSYALRAPAVPSTPEAGSGRYPVAPVILGTNDSANSVYRGALPDVWLPGNNVTTLPWLTTWNGFAYVKLGLVLFPWDGATDIGGGTKLGYLLAGTSALTSIVEEEEEEAAPAPVTFTNALPSDEADFGQDFDVLGEMPTSFVLASGRRNLANAIARRLQTPARFLYDAFGGDPDYGLDLRGRLNSASSLDKIAALEADTKDQVEQDERVQAADISATYDLAAASLTVDIGLHTPEGFFSLVLKVSDVTTELILTPEL